MEDHKQQNTSKNRAHLRWTHVLMVSGVLLVLIGGYLIWKFIYATSPLPKSVVERANFSIYYPSKLPEQYRYEEGSATYTNDSVIYTLDGPNEMVVTQQPNPQEKILFDKLGGFTPIGTTVGQAYIGQVDDRQVVLAQTATTLITITTGTDTPKTILNKIVQNLSEVND